MTADEIVTVGVTASDGPPPLRRVRRSWVLALSGWGVLGLTWLPPGSVARSWLVGLFLLTVPGTAALRFWPSGGRLERLGLAIALSLGASMIITELQPFFHIRGGRFELIVLAALTTVATLAPVPRAKLHSARRFPSLSSRISSRAQ